MPTELAVGIGLLTLRLWAALRAQVLWRSAVGFSWPIVAAALALMLAAAAAPVARVDGLEALIVAGVGELILGTLVGLGATLPGYALLGAGTAAAVVTRSAPRPLLALTVAVALASALALQLHRPLLVAIGDFGRAWPLGRPELWLEPLTEQGLPWLLGAAHATLVLALALATPVLLVAAVASVAVALVGRGPAPAATVADPLAAWARTAGAILALGASWAAYDSAWARAVLPP